MEGSVGRVQSTLQWDGGSRDRQWLDDETAVAPCTQSSPSATGWQDDSSSVNSVETVGVCACQRHNVHQSAPHQWLLATLHQYATCLLSSYQHDSWSSVAESLPHQNGRTFSSVLFNCNSKTAAHFTPTFLKRKVTVLYLQTASSRVWWYRLRWPCIHTVQTDVIRADAKVKFALLRAIHVLVSDAPP